MNDVITAEQAAKLREDLENCPAFRLGKRVVYRLRDVLSREEAAK